MIESIRKKFWKLDICLAVWMFEYMPILFLEIRSDPPPCYNDESRYFQLVDFVTWESVSWTSYPPAKHGDVFTILHRVPNGSCQGTTIAWPKVPCLRPSTWATGLHHLGTTEMAVPSAARWVTQPSLARHVDTAAAYQNQLGVGEAPANHLGSHEFVVPGDG